MTEKMICPKCGNDECWQDSADVEVGIIYGPWGCPMCGWSESEEYDLSEGKDPVDEKGGAIDQYGGYHPPGSVRARAFKFMKKVDESKTFCRQFVKLKSGENPVADLLVNLPKGYRMETDDEFRTRIIEETKEKEK